MIQQSRDPVDREMILATDHEVVDPRDARLRGVDAPRCHRVVAHSRFSRVDACRADREPTGSLRTRRSSACRPGGWVMRCSGTPCGRPRPADRRRYRAQASAVSQHIGSHRVRRGPPVAVRRQPRGWQQHSHSRLVCKLRRLGYEPEPTVFGAAMAHDDRRTARPGRDDQCGEGPSTMPILRRPPDTANRNCCGCRCGRVRFPFTGCQPDSASAARSLRRADWAVAEMYGPTATSEATSADTSPGVSVSGGNWARVSMR